ncbi:MAG: hypothetical protein Kow00109_26140 [Acidobacteriota bacterium]
MKGWPAALLLATILAWTACAPGEESSSRAQAPAPAFRNLLVVSIDTLRADHLQPYGYPRPVSPNLAALSGDAVLFEQAYTPVPITLPAHTSLLTGTYPAFHGVHDNSGFVASPELVTLAEVLRDAGYQTAAFVGSFILDSRFGLDQGFSHYSDGFQTETLDLVEQSIAEHRAAEVVERALQWLRRVDRRRPFFVFLHLFDPHAPYDPPADFPCPANDPYDCEIAYADAALGSLFDWLRRANLYESTCIVVTSDHGEGLGEHGEDTHGLFLYDATLHIPLLVKLPGGAAAGRRVTAPVRLIDVMPTVLQVLGEPIPEAVQGRSLAALWAGRERVPEPLLAETLLPALNYGWAPLYALRTERNKYIHAPRPELYDLETDPRETKNLVADSAALAASLKEQLEDLRSRYQVVTSRAERMVDPETAAMLRSLGYVSLASSRIRLEPGSGADPKDKIHLFNAIWRSLEFNRDGRTDEAARALDRVLREDPDIFVAHSLQALNLLRLGRPRDALPHLRAAARLRPDDPGAHLYLGLTYLQLGVPEEARRHLETALQLDPQNRAAANNLGAALVRLRDFAAAETLFRRLTRETPEDAAAWMNLGVVLLGKGDAAGAVAALEKARQLAPGIPEIHNNLGLAYASLGRRREAREAFRAALRLRPDYANARANLQRLEGSDH